jgi:hypothetical protein
MFRDRSFVASRHVHARNRVVFEASFFDSSLHAICVLLLPLDVTRKGNNMNFFNTHITLAAAVAAAFFTFGTVSNVDAVAKRGKVANADGGVTAGAAASRTTSKGTRNSARAVKTDAAGNKVGGSASSTTLANGGTAARAGKFQKNADGSASRQGAMSASGAKGSVSSSGGTTRNADGTVSGSRDTQATNNATGNSANVNSTYQSGQGVTRTATCTDAVGATIACPSR